MIDEPNEPVVIEHFAGVDFALLEPMVGAFQDSGISVRVLRDLEVGSQGCMGGLALLPTAVQVIVAVGPAIGGVLLHEAAKDAYGALKRGFAALWKNLHHTSDPGYSERFSMKLSVICEFAEGRRLKLLLNPRSQARDAEAALAQFFDVVKLKSDAGHSRSQVEALGGQTAVVAGVETQAVPERRDQLEIWVFNPRFSTLEPVDPDVE
jgi:hypothetical protein